MRENGEVPERRQSYRNLEKWLDSYLASRRNQPMHDFGRFDRSALGRHPVVVSTITAFIAVSTIIVLSAIIAAYAGLIVLSRWQGDEYFYFGYLRVGGVRFFIDRVLGWSPRPVSESIIFLYYQVVAAVHRPLATIFIVLLWTFLFACSLACMRRQRQAWPLRLSVALALPVFFLVGPGISETFYWPMGAAAYLTTIAATTLLFWELADGVAITRLLPILALVGIAGSCEVGALFALGFSVLTLPEALRQPDRRRALLFWILPGLLALLVVSVLVFGRVGTGEMAKQSGRYLHHLGASLWVAVPRLLLDLVSFGGDRVDALWVKFLFFLGVRWCWAATGERGSGRPAGLVAFSLASLGAAYLSIVAAYYQFDGLCCERHGTLRQCFIFLTIASLAVLSARPWPPRLVWFRMFAPLPIAAAALIAVADRVPALLHDYGLYQTVIAARSATWDSGRRPDAPDMVFHLPPEGRVVHGIGFPPGTYVRNKDLPWYIDGVLMFFDKQSVVISASSP